MTLGIAGDTVVIFTSDHGEWLGEHLRYGKGYPAPTTSAAASPSSFRPPRRHLHRPQRLSPHRVARRPAHHPRPVAGIQVPPPSAGLLPPAPAARRRARRRLAPSPSTTAWKSLRTESFRYLLHADGTEDLYDLSAEWGDYRDVSADPAYASNLAASRHELGRKLLAAERPLPRAWPY